MRLRIHARLTAWLTPAYSLRGTTLRAFLDLGMAAIGLTLGFVSTAVLYLCTDNRAGIDWAREFLLSNWASNLPLFCAICLFAFAVSGIYSQTIGPTALQRIIGIIRAGALAILLHSFFMFLTRSDLPRSSIIFGWIYVLGLMIFGRVSRYVFKSDEPDPPRPEIYSIAAEEMGWIAPGSSTARSNFLLWPFFDESDLRAVNDILHSGKVNRWTGNTCAQFEYAFADYCGAHYGLTVANGSVALEAALLGLGIGKSDEVIVPCRSFIATASSVVRVGAKAIFCDIDPDSQNLTAETVQPNITDKTRAIIAVHLAGWPCRMDELRALADRHNLWLIEDAAQAHGAAINGKRVGSLSDVAAFSFCQDKILTTGGEGGMVLTNNEDIHKKIWSLRDHGKDLDALSQPLRGHGYRWLHNSIGTNWRMTEMQAAIGLSQLKRLPQWLACRQAYAKRLTDQITDIPALRIPLPPPNVSHANYKFYAFVRPSLLKPNWNRNRILEEISHQGIPCFSGICGELYREKAFSDPAIASYPHNGFACAKELAETSLMFLVHPTLTEQDIDRSAAVIRNVLKSASLS